MNSHNMTPDYKSKEWLLYSLNEGYSQRQMARLCNVSTPTIRLWLNKYDIKWRNISESLLAQSGEVSKRAKKVWSDPEKRKKQSETMKRVQSTRKKELSASAKKNWAENRDVIVAGIRSVARSPTRLSKISKASIARWEDPQYRQSISEIMVNLWNTDEYRDKTTSATKAACQTPEFKANIAARWLNTQYRETIVKAIHKRCEDPTYKNKISQLSKALWDCEEYQTKQIALRPKRNDKISKAVKKLWENDDYRSKYETGIDIEKFIDTSIKRYGDQFNYDNTRFENWKTKISVDCVNCKNQLTKLPQTHIEHGYCDHCQTSFGQRMIYNIVSKHVDCIHNCRNVIKPLELDVYAKSKKLAVEHHGLYWHSYNRLESKNEKIRHQQKSILCRESGIRLLQFFDFEVINKSHIVESIITNAIGKSTRIGARLLTIKTIDSTTSKNFFNENHLSGYRTAAITLALCDNNETLMAMSLSRYKDGYEIIRMAAKTGHSITGGVSRLLKRFITTQEPKLIYTYADMRYSTGIGYKQAGFKNLGTTNPGYFYYRGNQILSRQRCQKHKLHKLLDDFDPDLTEAENMFINGYRRIWDAGHLKFKLTI